MISKSIRIICLVLACMSFLSSTDASVVQESYDDKELIKLVGDIIKHAEAEDLTAALSVCQEISPWLAGITAVSTLVAVVYGLVFFTRFCDQQNNSGHSSSRALDRRGAVRRLPTSRSLSLPTSDAVVNISTSGHSPGDTKATSSSHWATVRGKRGSLVADGNGS